MLRTLLSLMLLPLPAAVSAVSQQTAKTYRVEVSGVADERLAGLIDAVSVLRSRSDRPPENEAGLRRRIAEDRERILQVLRSEGYYQARLTADVDRTSDPPLVRLDISPGPRFHIGRFDARLTEGDPALLAPDKTPTLPGIGKPARAPEILAAEARLIGMLAERGHPFAKVADRKVVVDHAKQLVDVDLAIDPGSPAVFGKIAIEGLDDVKVGYVGRQIAWKEGEPYDQRKVDQTRRALVRTGLFDSVQIGRAETEGPGAQLPVAVTLAEADHRSVGASAEYATDVGIGGTVYWEHRNLFGNAEKLNLTAEASELRWAFRSQFAKPIFPTDRDTFTIGSEIKDERLEAYDARGISVTTGVTRNFGGGLTAGLGIGTEYTQIDDNGAKDKFVLLSLPAQVTYSTTDSPLDPSRGIRATFSYTPYFEPGGDAGLFHRLRLAVAGFYPVIEEDKRLVLAVRAAIGTLFGAAASDIPATTRFYAGGGGSIRGYAYQLAGPLDADRDPIGGRSLVEGSIEARVRITEDFGVVPFIDVGNAYRGSVPDPSGELRVAAGIGIRYFTSFGPLRADIAFPLNRRPGVDDRFQFYVGLGQAF